MSVAGVAHPVARHLAKVEVASSSLVTRSIKRKTTRKCGLSFLWNSAGDMQFFQNVHFHCLPIAYRAV